MEYAGGGSLLDRIYKTYIMTEEECKFLFYQIACALAYLHRLKIVRDLFTSYSLNQFLFRYEYFRFIEISNQRMFFSCQMNEKQLQN